MKNQIKIKVSLSFDLKDIDDKYSSWNTVFNKTSEEVLIKDSGNIDLEFLQKEIKSQVLDILVKSQKFAEQSDILIVKKQEEDFNTL